METDEQFLTRPEDIRQRTVTEHSVRAVLCGGMPTLAWACSRGIVVRHDHASVAMPIFYSSDGSLKIESLFYKDLRTLRGI